MAFMEWTEELSVKIPSIDRQHRTLIGYINKLDDALGRGHAEQLIEMILNGLVRYTTAHFMYEEMLFSLHHYPETDGHKIAHGKLYKKVDEFKQRFAQGDPTVGPELLDFLKSWLQKHILKEDMAYSGFFQECGVK
ncbi:MAG: bacteriohemerythrin [Gammaproteobacteria bacterium]